MKNSNLLRNPVLKMKANTKVETPINEINSEINEQDLVGQSGGLDLGYATRMTLAGRCGKVCTLSAECNSNHVSCGN